MSTTSTVVHVVISRLTQAETILEALEKDLKLKEFGYEKELIRETIECLEDWLDEQSGSPIVN